jgi:endonuclease/exonuclease/phosphatase family metal-dependent hydrolase
MRHRLAVALLAAVVSSLLIGAPARAEAPPVTAMTFNACGNVCRHGEVELTTANIAYQIRTRRVSVAMLQELCYSQFLGLRDRLAGSGYSALFATATRGGHCDDHDRRHGKAFGLALITRGRLTGGVAHRLVIPFPGSEEGRMVLGATVHLPGRTVFAVTTHTVPRGPNLARQVNAISRWLSPLAADHPVLFGGDLNSLPDNPDLDRLYASFTEADGDRADPMPTFITPRRKIDYLFGSRGHLTARDPRTACGWYSDHCMYLGAFH